MYAGLAQLTEGICCSMEWIRGLTEGPNKMSVALKFIALELIDF